MMLSFSEAPTKLERIVEDRRASMQRATVRFPEEEIPCPGGCGKMASLESPITITRDGVTRTVRMAQCQGNCRLETKNPRTGRLRSTPARFDIPWESPASATVTAPATESLAEALARTLSTSGITQCEAGALIGCSQSSVSKLLRGLPVSTSTMAAAQDWINSLLEGSPACHPTGESQATEATLEPPLALAPKAPQSGEPQPTKANLEPPLALAPKAPQSGEPQPTKANLEPPLALAPKAPQSGEPQPTKANLEPPLALAPKAPQSGGPQPTKATLEPPLALAPDEARVAAANTGSDACQAACSVHRVGSSVQPENPYQAVLRRLLEQVAQSHLEQVAGPAAEGVRVRVVLEWDKAGTEDKCDTSHL
jgi:hypothetical protein